VEQGQTEASIKTRGARHAYGTIARFYDVLDLPFEYGRYRKLRHIVFSGTRGRILDAGVGTGRNMPFYPAEGRVIGADLSLAMLSRAAKRRHRISRTVELVQSDILSTPFTNASFDYVISTFLFCVLDADQQLPALRELGRICKAEGEIRILEYVFSGDPFRRFIMYVWAPWVRFAYGAHFDRQTRGYVEAAGLELVTERFLYSDIIKLLVLRPRREGSTE
jgi:ubiquinone/menaquinone biosynthesis C-methylase UbiE